MVDKHNMFYQKKYKIKCLSPRFPSLNCKVIGKILWTLFFNTLFSLCTFFHEYKTIFNYTLVYNVLGIMLVIRQLMDVYEFIFVFTVNLKKHYMQKLYKGIETFWNTLQILFLFPIFWLNKIKMFNFKIIQMKMLYSVSLIVFT